MQGECDIGRGTTGAVWCDECGGWGEWIEPWHMKRCPACNGAGWWVIPPKADDVFGEFDR